MVKEILLTKGKVALVDDEDHLTFNAERLCNTFYAVRQQTIKGYKFNVRMHRVILNVQDSKQQVDHVDGNGLNNIRSNLRVCTASQNQQNRYSKLSNTTSKYKGVCWAKADRVWVAYIKLQYKNLRIGSFNTEIEAAHAYDAKAIELFGEYAHTNFSKEECKNGS